MSKYDLASARKKLEEKRDRRAANDNPQPAAVKLVPAPINPEEDKFWADAQVAMNTEANRVVEYSIKVTHGSK